MYKSAVLALLVASVFGIASQFDWRNVGAITAVGNMGSCDASIAFVVATLYSAEYYR